MFYLHPNKTVYLTYLYLSMISKLVEMTYVDMASSPFDELVGIEKFSNCRKSIVRLIYSDNTELSNLEEMNITKRTSTI